MSSCLLNSTCLLSLQNSDAKYVSNKMLWQFQNFSVCLTSTLAEKSAKDSAETFAYYVGNGFAKPWHFAKGSDLVFQQLRLFVLPKLYYLFIIFPLLIPWFGFFMRPCYSRRTHPTLQKPGVKNLAACENEGKQCKPRMMKRK